MERSLFQSWGCWRIVLFSSRWRSHTSRTRKPMCQITWKSLTVAVCIFSRIGFPSRTTDDYVDVTKPIRLGSDPYWCRTARIPIAYHLSRGVTHSSRSSITDTITNCVRDNERMWNNNKPISIKCTCRYGCYSAYLWHEYDFVDIL